MYFLAITFVIGESVVDRIGGPIIMFTCGVVGDFVR